MSIRRIIENSSANSSGTIGVAFLISCVGVFVWRPLLALAQEASPLPSRVEQLAGYADPLSLVNLSKMLLIVSLACLVTVLLLKKFGKPGAFGGPAEKEWKLKDVPSLRIVRRVRIDTKNEFLVLATSNGDFILFSSGHGGVKLHGELDATGKFSSDHVHLERSLTHAVEEGVLESGRWKLGGAPPE